MGRVLSKEEVKAEARALNELKKVSKQVEKTMALLGNCVSLDQRWVAEARTDLQKGFMCAERAITKPDNF
tara:strand:+ start:236 stop:445 length:210 start_codon:yes stop_codon:yes gene_type:complete